jgi:triphosphoribosyl-dephospho-CoA synthase
VGKEVPASIGDIGDYVSGRIQLALLLEVSAYPKPGNVHRTRDFEDTRYEDFLASAVAVSAPLREASRRGCFVSAGKIGIADVRVGSIVKSAVRRMNSWQSGGNTILGSILLLVPVAVAAGAVMYHNHMTPARVRARLTSIIRHTTPLDAVEVYDAIRLAKPGGMGRIGCFDVTDRHSRRAIVEQRKTLLDIFNLSSQWDSIAYEWAKGYPITFELGYPYFIHQLKKTDDIRIATVHTFLNILSKVPDTLIARRVGTTKSREISSKSKLALAAGGLLTEKGRRMIEELDCSLRTPKHELNPGTTADLTASTLAVAMLEGRRI